ncbi:inositol monophosphatase family protein [Catenulispora rubra]|uniref:inositol monophosphatase family protein n=1 Tax=Catenulispora rubra TaxID=280293 RepID=UPI001E300C2C|nr:inositol monophosphatase family protein [Catenulispora rubra]
MPLPRPATLGAIRVAREAATLIRRSAAPRRLRFKASSADLVTATDLRVERLVRSWLKATHPEHAIVGEEGGGLAEMDPSRPTWFVDPVDGTTNFVRGIPHCACSIAFWDGQRLALGVVADVARRRIYWAEAGRGAYEGQRRLRVSPVRRLDRAVLATGFPPTRSFDTDDNLAEFSSVFRQSRDVRRTGSAAIDLAWVAAGRLDCYWEQRCGPWDWAAGVLLVREAGGKATTYAGLEWHPGDADLVASNGPVHPALVESFCEARAAGGLPVRPPQPVFNAPVVASPGASASPASPATSPSPASPASSASSASSTASAG